MKKILLITTLLLTINVFAATRFITAFGMAQSQSAEQATADAISQATENLLNECSGSVSGIHNSLTVSHSGGDGWPVTPAVPVPTAAVVMSHYQDCCDDLHERLVLRLAYHTHKAT